LNKDKIGAIIPVSGESEGILKAIKEKGGKSEVTEENL
jgi:hypothetical protein